MLGYDRIAARIAPRLKAERERLGKDKRELAQELGFGLGNYSSYENKSVPGVDRLLALAEYFGCSLDYLLGRTEIREVAGEAPTHTHTHTHLPEQLTLRGW